MMIQQNCGMVRFNEPWTMPIVTQKRHSIVSKFEIDNDAIKKYIKCAFYHFAKKQEESCLTVACGIVIRDNEASCLLLYPQYQ